MNTFPREPNFSTVRESFRNELLTRLTEEQADKFLGMLDEQDLIIKKAQDKKNRLYAIPFEELRETL